MAVIYRHLKSDGEVFYIGIGKTESRAYSKADRNKFWNNLVNKHGYEVQILKKDLTWEDACELEKILIDWYGRRDLGTGTLVNMTNGGEGSYNRIVTEETRAKMRLSQKGKIYTKETRAKMSLSQQKNRDSFEKNQKIRIALTGKTLSDEHKKNITLSHKGSKHTEETKAKISASVKLSHLKRKQKYT
jgi:hypothetical protein